MNTEKTIIESVSKILDRPLTKQEQKRVRQVYDNLRRTLSGEDLLYEIADKLKQ